MCYNPSSKKPKLTMKAETWRSELKQRWWINTAYWLTSGIMFSFFSHSFQDHMPRIALLPWDGPSNPKQQLRKCQIDLPTVQSGGCIPPIKVPSLQMTLVCDNLTKTNSSAQPLSFLGMPVKQKYQQRHHMTNWLNRSIQTIPSERNQVHVLLLSLWSL